MKEHAEIRSFAHAIVALAQNCDEETGSTMLTASVNKSIQAMRAFLANKGISAREEFSDARWVYRFRVEASKEIHKALLSSFSTSSTQ